MSAPHSPLKKLRLNKKIQKPLDKQSKSCYNKAIKGKGITPMRTNINYMNCATGEITNRRYIAMDWYRGGDEVSLITYSEVCGEWVERGRWEH